MASNYPGSLDSFDTIASDKKTSDAVGGRTHRQMHNDLGDAIEAVQAELGTDPAGDYATVKARLEAAETFAYATKTSAYTATTSDDVINVTSGTFTLDLPAASTCTGKTLRVKNSGTGVVTLDGNSSETIEGVATFPLGSGSYVEILSTGSAWVLIGGIPDTGWRNLSAENSWSFSSLRLRRRGNTVTLTWTGSATMDDSASADTFYTLPTGFRPQDLMEVPMTRQASGSAYWQISNAGGCQRASGSSVTASSYNSVTFQVGTSSGAWPASLPGTAA